VLEVEGDADLTVSHIATLRAMFSTLKNGEATVEEMFGLAKSADHKIVENPLSDEPEKDAGQVAGDAKADEAAADANTATLLDALPA
jgi:hypothetical protein